MTATLILWGHALAALLFAAVALGLRSEGGAGRPRAALTVALLVTALWALAVAGIDPRDLSVRLLVALRDLAWLGALLAMVAEGRRPARTLLILYAATAAVALLAGAVAVAEAGVGPSSPAASPLDDVRLVLRSLALLGALLLVHQFHAGAVTGSPRARLVAVALAVMWGDDLLLLAAGQATHRWPAALVAARGGVMAAVALLLAAGIGREAGQPLAVSRAAAARVLWVLALAAYTGLVAVLTGFADAVGGSHARLAQTAIVVGATAALLTLLATPRLRAWGRVMLAKHLFSHRYDYRGAWQRFSETLAGVAADHAPLGERVAQAIAEITVSPAALLLEAEGETLAVAAGWRWPARPAPADLAPLARYLAENRRIVGLDEVRAGTAPADEREAVPSAIRDDPDLWAIVPLADRAGLVGAVVLARPPLTRALDWEDFDLLRVAGRQAAGALAEDRARRALADAERFDEFNRRFAFILHDIKNLVSQLGLVARNAQRHADNPAFRADMVATLTESADRMQALLARLSPQAGRRERVEPIEAGALLAAVAARHRRGHPVATGDGDEQWLLADRAGLETVLDHLVQNAVEASPAGAPVTLAAACRDGRVTIQIADRGHGMSAAFVRDQLFRPFASTKPGGFGLGAFEARQFAQAMAGRLEVESREGEGTRVTLHLPAATPLEAAA